MASNLSLVRDYLAAIQRGASFDEIAGFFSEDIEQVEFPNRFVPTGAIRGLKELREAAERGRKVISSQRYEVLSATCEDDRVALEVQWTGLLAVPIGKLAPGDAMRAKFGVFFQIRNGKIVRQHNYDCFDPF